MPVEKFFNLAVQLFRISYFFIRLFLRQINSTIDCVSALIRDLMSLISMVASFRISLLRLQRASMSRLGVVNVFRSRKRVMVGEKPKTFLPLIATGVSSVALVRAPDH